MASKNKIIEIIGAIKTIYPYYAKETNVELLVNTWQALFNNYDDKELETAFMLCLKTCKTPPTPADIIEQIKKTEELTEPTKEQKWNELLSVIEKARDLVYKFDFTFKDENGQTQGQKARKKFVELYNTLPSDLKSFIGGQGELKRLADADDSELKYKRSEFLKSYPEIKERQKSITLLNSSEDKEKIADTERLKIEK
ncbi:MAG: replicative helicase loader/inhibitor [Acutalibacteraceae bacterium]|nr:replicative helicase loader/inhibitor [Acutalibacteraceae bacterium]